MTLTKDEALAAMTALYAHAAYRTGAMAYAMRYTEHTGFVPDWLVAMTTRTNRWYVRHGCMTYETNAVSRADAVNNIRFNLYGRKPADECGDFDAINPAYIVLEAVGGRRRAENSTAPRDLFGKRITKQDALMRLRRMAS